jgi:hypothetical protein
LILLCHVGITKVVLAALPCGDFVSATPSLQPHKVITSCTDELNLQLIYLYNLALNYGKSFDIQIDIINKKGIFVELRVTAQPEVENGICKCLCGAYQLVRKNELAL